MPGWVGHGGVEQDVGNVGVHLSIRGGFARNNALLHTLMISPVPKDMCSCPCPTLFCGCLLGGGIPFGCLLAAWGPSCCLRDLEGRGPGGVGSFCRELSVM